ncbi:hypothetical protein [Flindersiella endophytica]
MSSSDDHRSAGSAGQQPNEAKGRSMAKDKKIIVIGKQRETLDVDLAVQILLLYVKRLVQEQADQEAASNPASDDDQTEAS